MRLGCGAQLVVCLVNLITQDGGYGHGAKPGQATLKNVRKSLKKLKKMAKKEKFSSMALPKLATGVGNLDWDDVKPLIYEQLGEMKIPVYLYTVFHEGKQAQESA